MKWYWKASLFVIYLCRQRRELSLESKERSDDSEDNDKEEQESHKDL